LNVCVYRTSGAFIATTSTVDEGRRLKEETAMPPAPGGAHKEQGRYQNHQVYRPPLCHLGWNSTCSIQ